MIAVSDAEILVMLRSMNPAVRRDGVIALLTVHGGKVESVVKKSIARFIDEPESIVGLAVVRLLKTIDQVKSESLGPYFMTIAMNIARDELRGRKFELQRTLSLDTGSEKVRFAAESAWVTSDRSDTETNEEDLFLLRDAILCLPRLVRDVVEADLAAGGLADSRILAARLNTTVNAIYAARSKGKKLLFDAIKKAKALAGECSRGNA